MSQRIRPTLRQRLSRWARDAALFAAGALVVALAPRVLDIALPPTEAPADLKLRIRNHDEERGRVHVYVTNTGDQAAVVERLEICPPDQGWLHRRSSGEAINLSELAELWVARGYETRVAIRSLELEGGSRDWSADCGRDRGFVLARLVDGSPEVAGGGSTELTFEAPKYFKLWTQTEIGPRRGMPWCAANLVGDGRRFATALPCIAFEDLEDYLNLDHPGGWDREVVE